MSIPSILPDIEGDGVLDYLWLRLQNPQASQNVVRSLNNQRPCLDIEEQLEVHCKAELHKDPENLQGRSTQAMVSCPHESQSLCTSQPPGNKVKYKQTNKQSKLPGMAERATLHILHLWGKVAGFEGLDQLEAHFLVC